MAIRYEEWLPGPALGGVVTSFWCVSGDGARVPAPAILPDRHVELVFNLGDPVLLAGRAFRGEQPNRAVVGPLSHAVRLDYRGRVRTFGIRFHPARGGSFFGKRASELANRIVPLAQVNESLDRAVAQVLHQHPELEHPDGRVALDAVLARQLAGSRPDEDVIAAVDNLMRASNVPTVADLARTLGKSPRQLQRRFLAVVGLAPKRFVRVVRFARVWQLALMSPVEGWADLAAEHGFADQAHLVREFRAFGAEPPAHLFAPDWYANTASSRSPD